LSEASAPAVHATVVATGEWAVAILGPSGSGKSDLALRLIDRGAVLVGDDYVHIRSRDDLPWASAAPALAGKLEVRGIGVLPFEFRDTAMLRLCVVLGKAGERMPDPWPTAPLAGFSIPCLLLNGFEASAPIKVELAVKSVVDAGLWPVPVSAHPLLGES
jgi:HPr kinase/phosphorylase